MSKSNGARTKKTSKRAKPQPATKTEKIIQLLKRSSGTTIAELQKTTGWQAHSVRGFLSGTLKKRMELNVISALVKAWNGARYCGPRRGRHDRRRSRL